MREIDGKIEYTPEELQEIERILGYISQETLGHLPANKIPADAGTETMEHTYDAPEKDIEPRFEAEEKNFQQKFKEYPEDIEMLGQDIGEEEQDYQEEPEEVEKIEDITDLIQEIKTEEESGIPEETFEEIPLEKITTREVQPEEPFETAEEEDLLESVEPVAKEKIQDIPEEDEFNLDLLTEELEKHQIEEEPIETIPPKIKISDKNKEKESLIDEGVFEELEPSLLKEFEIEEPENSQDTDVEQQGIIEEESLDLDISAISPTEEIDVEVTKSAKPVKKTTIEKTASQSEDKFPDIDFAGLDESKVKSDKTAPAVEPVFDDIHEADLSSDLDKIQDLFTEEKPAELSPDSGIIPSVKPAVIDEFASIPQEQTEDEIELTDSELKKLNKVIQFFHPNLTKIVKDVILNDLLPGTDIRDLVNMLLAKVPEKEIKAFIEKKLNTKIDTSVELPTKGRRVISARPEYTKEGRERQSRLYKISGLVAVAAVVLIVIGVLLYQNIYIPVMAKKYIDEGVSLIKKPGVPVIQKQKDYKKAEEIFNNVNDNYIKDYLYGYHSYARAYFQNKEYDYALDKLNKAYDINPLNIDTLNNLGFFYSKLPEANFEKIKPQLENYYFKKLKPVGPVDKQIDVAIDFYKKAISIDPKNISALFGIGNAYTNQGEFSKARQFYENILAVNKESVVGYSGLLNLFIERDALPEIISIHADLENKQKLSEVPSALLAKLAAYYLSKKRTDEKNIRIDYGVQSNFIKDFDDNPYPAVKNVLNALSAKDMDYPPLFLQFARLSKEENNLNLMKRNLQTALEKDSNYFAAHILLAEYYYTTNDPVEAYKSSKKALQAYLSPPGFTNDDFYYETEKIGTAYAIMGNIFYYADKTKFRFGDEFEDENTQEKSDELSNYSIAQDKYEKAIAENYKSGEVFYNLGRIYYLKSQFEKAATLWLNLYEDFTAEPELLFALGNAFYHQNNLEASKGEFMKVISTFENKADRITQIIPARTEHTRIFQTLSSAYNNLGAVYQVQNNETKCNISYWKAIDYAKKIDRENEFARVNLAKAFKPNRENVLPILDENIAESVANYKEFK